MTQREKALERLAQMGIEYQIVEHPAVYTIEEMQSLGLPEHGHICKNLFLRDSKGKRHFLVTMEGDRRADLVQLAGLLDSTKLSFASAERLEKYLGLHKGEVTPLGIINDESHAVEVVLDKALWSHESVGVHPNDNTATVWISPADLERLVRENGNELRIVDFGVGDD